MSRATSTTDTESRPAPRTPTPGRVWAYTGLVLGAAVSVAANVAHSYVPPADLAPGQTWAPEPGAVLGATFWPLALLASSEILIRTNWPTGWRWIALRAAGLLPVAAVAAVVSYLHLHGLLLHYRESPVTAAIGPLSVDGLMVMATGALLATSPTRTGTSHAAGRSSAEPEARVPIPSPTGVSPAGSGAAQGPAPLGIGPAPSITDPVSRPGRRARPIVGVSDGQPVPTRPNPIESAPIGLGTPSSEPIRSLDPVPIANRSDRGAAGSDDSVRDGPSGRSRGRRSIEDLYAATVAAIGSGDLPPNPSAEALRRHFRIGPARARALRDRVSVREVEQALPFHGQPRDLREFAPGSVSAAGSGTAGHPEDAEPTIRERRNPTSDNGFRDRIETPTDT